MTEALRKSAETLQFCGLPWVIAARMQQLACVGAGPYHDTGTPSMSELPNKTEIRPALKVWLDKWRQSIPAEAEAELRKLLKLPPM